ncbi:serine hydrolase domain-containing protein [Amycolatopsis sp. H20-H5]|uniref:serine hydrolase domain-containing protein n=1 Tax=Amycolatopsis sp. H20-H5 TaxID=3046309 RepID=UPI002DBAD8FF|nr:serine hydrolase domain-containing protein [Amycolatopsis sp. H20-H5]MEC3980265.1 serine hydrolase domain-containing protein [Amycolatopsis sp. H20-H5]
MSTIDEVLREAVESGAVPQVAAIAANRDGVFYEGAAGPREVGGTDAAGLDTHFRIMSMTKMVATTVALQQAEKGALDLDAPVDTYRPEFADLQVIDGFDGDTPRLRPPASRATVKQLITHTAGLGYWFWNDELVRWEAATGVPNVVAGSGKSFTAPLVADPGTKYNYGINTDWLGKVVEAVAGVTLDVAVKDGITGPLGMDETTFLMNDEQRAGCTPVHVKGEDGDWVSAGEILNQAPDWWAAGHGLYSTPHDYIKFERALLRGGELDGVRILRQETVDAAFTNQIGELDFPETIPTADPASSGSFSAGPGCKWGYGLLLNTEDVPGHRRAGSGAWAGLCNTHFWIDRTTGICASIYSNFLPFVTPEAMKMYSDFEEALYASL